MRITIIGAGIVGLHIANLLQHAGHEVFVLEQEAHLAEHTSGRNSGVIHAGIFYEAGSLKEELCLEGNALTHEWALQLGIGYRPCGKWVLPATDDASDLEAFFERVRQLPIPSPRLFSADEVSRAEPALRRTRAVLIPSTGLVDAAGYVKALARCLEDRGVSLLFCCRVLAAQGERLETTRGPIESDVIINAAGLFADEVARLSGRHDYEIRPCRGDYYIMNAQPLTRPVYHIPATGGLGLGVHLTPTLDGQTLFGPNAFPITTKNDYQHYTGSEAYAAALAHDLPGFAAPPLQAAYTGNRPKLFKQGQAHPDFEIIKEKHWIHLLGIESPGLTGAPALAQRVLALL